ncbi:MAG: hypothetical protein ACLFSE_12365 [Spirochaetia bacterium]
MNRSLGKYSDTLRDELIEPLHQLIRDTEKIYLRFGEEFPALQEEMERSLAKSASFTDGKNRDTNTGKKEQIENVIRETSQAIETGIETFSKMSSRDKQLFSELDQGISHLGSLEQMINNIKEDTIEMELISLNAMTVALKAGQAGRAFSYITDELQRLSARTRTLTESISRRGDGLLEIFKEYRQKVGDIREFQDRLSEEFREKLVSSFESFKAGVDNTVSALSAISSGSREIRKPLTKVMEEIQLQDIIRQSIDHVILSLQEFKDIEDDASTEMVLDELSFLELLPDLCTVLLDDIKQNILRSLEIFRKNVKEAEDIIQNAEKERQKFITSVSENGDAELDRSFDQSTQMIAKLIEDLEQSISLKEDLSTRSRFLIKEVFSLEEDFQTFTTIINRFHSIDVASRIEVAKQEVLQQMTGTVEEMTDLTSKIENDVTEALTATKEFIQGINKTVMDFSGRFQQDESFVSTFQTQIKGHYQSLFDSRDALSQRIAGFSVFTGKFLTLFETTTQNLSDLEILLSDIDMIKEKLMKVKEQARRHKEPILNQLGKNQWDISNNKLRDIIKRFTIFTHKKTAGELGGFNVEEGASAGEITFF